MNTMTPRQRLVAATKRQPVDRIPCSPRIAVWLMEQYGDGEPATYLKARERFNVFDPHTTANLYTLPSALACCESYDLPDVDYRYDKRLADDGFTEFRRTFVTPKGTLTDVTRIPPAGDRRFGMAPNPIRSESLVKSPSDLDALRYLIPDKSGGAFDAFRDIEKTFGDNGLVMPNILSALCHRAGDVYPMEELMMDWYGDRAFFNELVDIFQQDMMDEVRRCLEEGVIHLFANWYYNSLSAGWSPAIWEEVFAPQLKQMCDTVHAAGGTVNFYDDGKFMMIADLLVQCGIDVLQTLTPPPIADANLAELKSRIGDRVCLMGYVDLIYIIKQGTPQQIRDTVREAIKIAGPTGFILGTSDSIRDGTPMENVEAYFEAAAQYGDLSAATA
jgi:uroporphyrinogen-III decarboxylase